MERDAVAGSPGRRERACEQAGRRVARGIVAFDSRSRAMRCEEEDEHDEDDQRDREESLAILGDG